MKKLREELSGGNIHKNIDPFRNVIGVAIGNSLGIRMPQEGDVSSVIKTTTFEAELKLPYKLTMKEVTVPPKDSNGVEEIVPDDEKIKYEVEVKLPFALGHMTGHIEVHVNLKDVSFADIPDRILESIGDNLAMFQIKVLGE